METEQKEQEQVPFKLEQYPELRAFVNETIVAVTDGLKDANESSPLMKYNATCGSIEFNLPKAIVGSNGIIISTSFIVDLREKSDR